MKQIFKNFSKKILKPVVFLSIPAMVYKALHIFENEKKNAEKIYSEIKKQNTQSQKNDYEPSAIERNLRMYLNRNIVETLKEDEVREGGVEYLNQIIRQKMVIDAILDVLLFCVKDDEFLEEAKGLGNVIYN